MNKPREYTKEEIRKKVLDHIRGLVDYWDSIEFSNPERTKRETLEGLAFSILVMLDGGSVGLPGFEIIPSPHPEDKDYNQRHENNWYPDDIDIGGDLHSEFYKDKRI